MGVFVSSGSGAVVSLGLVLWRIFPPFLMTRFHQFPEGYEDVVVPEEMASFSLSDMCSGDFPFP